MRKTQSQETQEANHHIDKTNRRIFRGSIAFQASPRHDNPDAQNSHKEPQSIAITDIFRPQQNRQKTSQRKGRHQAIQIQNQHALYLAQEDAMCNSNFRQTPVIHVLSSI
jgi:hypothetical protein